MTSTKTLICVLLFALFRPPLRGQQFQQSSTMPLTQAGTGMIINESGSGTNVHTLAWTTAGAPTVCTIALEMSSSAGGPFTPLGSPQNCQLTPHGSLTVSSVTPNFVRINLQAFAGTMASVSYTYTGFNTVASAAFASADLWSKLDALRSIEALKHGITTGIHHCPLYDANHPINDLPYPTDQEFQLYEEPFGSELTVAASFGDTGANGIPSAQTSIQTEALGQLEFESDHYFYDWTQCVSHHPTLSFGGAVGLRPALVLEDLSSTTTTISNPNVRPMFQDAFGWTLGPKLNFVTSHNSQLALFGSLGENYLVSQVTSFKQGDNTVTATPISNRVGQSAVYFDSGLEWRLFNTDIVNAYINKTDVMNPPFTIALGYHDDTRFKRGGEIAMFADPQAYYFLRFSVGLNKIFNWNTTTVEPGKGYTFKFGVDYERPIKDSRMPTATLYFVSADFDIVHVFKPSTQPSTPAPQGQTPAPQPPAAHALFTE